MKTLSVWLKEHYNLRELKELSQEPVADINMYLYPSLSCPDETKKLYDMCEDELWAFFEEEAYDSNQTVLEFMASLDNNENAIFSLDMLKHFMVCYAAIKEADNITSEHEFGIS